MSQKTKKKRIRNWTAEDRAVHRDFEKSRREAFSESLTELTELLPTLKPEPRPSKHAIVDASITYHRAQQARYLQVTQALQSLMTERDDLLREVNGLRALCHPGTCIPRQARPVDPAVLGMLGSKLLVVDPLAGDHDSSEQQPVASEHLGGSPLASDRLGQPPSTVPQVSAPVFPGGMSMPHGPDPEVSSTLETGVGVVDLPEWAWDRPPKVSHQLSIPSNIADDAGLLWNQHQIISTTTPPEDVDPSRDIGPSHLVDNSALFWTQQVGMLNDTPPRDDGVHYESPETTIWPLQHLSLNVLPEEARRTTMDQMQQSTISFSSDLKSLSIPMGQIAGNDLENPSATMC
ncbi:hypothetical protein PENARI_c004G04271 [Penicillium arizonense]|uniref:BHLH domain-containing protein n=1 Tax=Penicillium arizonense TaxID=1835702 RepID=A0A1F5LSH1_PENAI|nr:hypothetical protein PENARI_c004G04271 [Penicillium arizonense]OGE55801.1 hypothetical protein PENARI_c004G04271 [Penicillium arizonense]